MRVRTTGRFLILMCLILPVSGAHALSWDDVNPVKIINRVVVQPATHAIQALGTVAEGVGKTLVGNPEGPKIAERGGKALGQAAIEAAPAILTAIVPVVGPSWW